MLTKEQRDQFTEILEELGKTLDISATEHEAVERSYVAVGSWLSRVDSELAPYEPVISPQGSFRLGTMIKPINENDDLDIDLVCELQGKKESWTQADLKKVVGDRLKAHKGYEAMLDKEGRRCWTLEYAEASNYHMDILPSIVCVGYRLQLEKVFSSLSASASDMNSIAIRITDNKRYNYLNESNPDNWLKSNPFGYAKWFFNRAEIPSIRLFSAKNSVNPVPSYETNKLPLQRVVQILKRHRDMMFNGADDKPISIIITTLAAKAYNKQTNIIDTLRDVINLMDSPKLIEERYDAEKGRMVKWIGNPVNDEENFADKWAENPQKQINFYKWLATVKIDVQNIVNQKEKGLQYISESFQRPFGKEIVTKVFSNYGDNLLKRRENGQLKMAAGTGMISEIGRTTIQQHKPFGKNE
ncbi:SMODS domain-containing nucleotidyltransferase [Parasediminibacterium sp. JCM 36343]|uniref:SMODS domain-containing nucleotidyltransferase n=1 Tax=Parasediminibacterium sp. JCM 36343 TaxID=3374279 RepID=UPI00397AB237